MRNNDSNLAISLWGQYGSVRLKDEQKHQTQTRKT